MTYWPQLVVVWSSGAFVDADDAMRLVQVRALMDGQSWFDMTAHRLDPPVGSFMHWSRIVDVPLVLLIKSFGWFADIFTAERLARLVFPLALLLILFIGVARLGDVLLGSIARLPAIAATVLSGSATYQFQPGRIDHHAPQIVILVFMVAAVVEALEPALARRAAIGGVLAALSLAIGLENLPFIVCFGAFFLMSWIWYGTTMAPVLRWFAFGLAGGLVLFFLITVDPQRWFDPVCDGLGMAHLGAVLIGAVGCAVTTSYDAAASTLGRRCAAAIGVMAPAALYVATAYPACLHDPFAGVDPLVREIWIKNVSESMPFFRAWQEESSGALLQLMPVVLGLCGAIGAALTSPTRTALRFLLIAALIAIGLAGAIWQIRVFASLTPLAVCGALPLAVWLHGRMRRAGRDLLAILALCLVFPFTSAAWALALAVPEQRGSAVRNDRECFTPSAFGPIAALPPGRVLAPIDAGPFFLAHTALSVFAAPYHRNNDGNRFALVAFSVSPERAHSMLVAREADYLAVCSSFGDIAFLAKREPEGLAAALSQGAIPPGFVPIPLTGTPFRLFRVTRTPQARWTEASAAPSSLPLQNHCRERRQP